MPCGSWGFDYCPKRAAAIEAKRKRAVARQLAKWERIKQQYAAKRAA